MGEGTEEAGAVEEAATEEEDVGEDRDWTEGQNDGATGCRYHDALDKKSCIWPVENIT